MAVYGCTVVMGEKENGQMNLSVSHCITEHVAMGAQDTDRVGHCELQLTGSHVPPHAVNSWCFHLSRQPIGAQWPLPACPQWSPPQGPGDTRKARGHGGE